MHRGGGRSLSGYGDLMVRTRGMRGGPGERRSVDTGFGTKARGRIAIVSGHDAGKRRRFCAVGQSCRLHVRNAVPRAMTTAVVPLDGICIEDHNAA
jgi:hypothetical protein